MPIPYEKRGGLTRRRFVTGLVAGGAFSSLPDRASAMTALAGSPPSLAAPVWNLTVGQSKIEIDRKRLNAPCIGGTVPGPILRWREGDTVEVTVTNTLKHEATSLHWHGIRLPAQMDGVPGISFEGIEPGASFTYRFKVQQSGTYWYHGHSGMQEAQGLYGAIVIDPAQPEPNPCARDYVVMLSEWTDVDPADILSTLKMQSDYYNFRQRTVASLPTEARKAGGVGAALKDRLAWSKMRMAATDISDVSGIIYSYLINGQAPDTNWLGLFQPGERVKLRFINAASMTFFDVRIPGLEMVVVQADGNPVEPVVVDEFRIGVAETYDVIVQPKEHKAYTIFAQSEDRTGFARGTLAPNAGMSAPIPPMDPRPVRTMADMGMSMGSMPAKAEPHDMGDMSAMDDMSDMDMAGMDMGADRGKPKPEAQPTIEIDDPGPPPLNVENQYRAAMPLDRLSSPGDGLEHNGRRVLNYAQLRATRPGRDPRPPSREIILHLTGNMERYIWGFNGRKFSESGPIRLKRNERVRFTLINDTMMEHPIHLHGLWSELENGQGDYRPYKHTLISQPGSRLSYLVTADAPGMWAYHCHLMLHMDQGMFRTVIVA